MSKQDIRQKLYERIESIGEGDYRDMHIIDTTEYMPDEGCKTFRIYHSDGYCFEVSKSIDTEDEETGAPLTFYYDIDTYFDGFKDISADQAFKLLSKIK
jgi:hypothetical protein